MLKKLPYKDDELLRLYKKSRDSKWIGLLLEKYTLLLFGVCMKYLKDEELAREVVQQIYLKVLTALPKTNINNFGGWIYRIARNECFTRLRQSHHKEWVEDWSNQPAEEELSMEDSMAEEQKFKQLERALNELNTPQRECIRLFYFKEKSYREIAKMKGISIKKVKSHIQNGKRNLRLRLTGVFQRQSKGGHHA